MADLERTRRQGAPGVDRHRERAAVGDGDEYSDKLDACRLRARFLGRLVTPHRPSPADLHDSVLDLAANPRLKKSSKRWQGDGGRDCACLQRDRSEFATISGCMLKSINMFHKKHYANNNFNVLS